MKWKYQNEEEKKEEECQQIVNITAPPPSGGSVTKIVENNLYFLWRHYRSKCLRIKCGVI